MKNFPKKSKVGHENCDTVEEALQKTVHIINRLPCNEG